MSGMTTETLTDRDLDVAVAEAMGHGWQGGNPIPGLDGRWPWPPPYSSADCSGLALVLSRLAELVPTLEEAKRIRRGDRIHGEPYLEFTYCPISKTWDACYSVDTVGGSRPLIWKSSDQLPAAACHLLVAWAARKGRES